MGDTEQYSSSSAAAAWQPSGGGSFVVKNTFLHCTVEEENDYQNKLISRFCRAPRPKSEPPRERSSRSPAFRQRTSTANRNDEDDSTDDSTRWADEPELTTNYWQPQVTAPATTTRAWESTWEERREALKNSIVAKQTVDVGGEPESPLSRTPQAANGEDSAARRRSRFNEQRRICEDPMPWNAGVVTVMIRQVPRRYSQQQFLEKVVEHGFEGLITFVYLPVAMKKFVNVGYGFVSFTEPQHALRFRDTFDDGFLDMPPQSDDKPLRIHPATVQGYQAACLYFSWKPKDMRCGPIFLGPNGTGEVEVLGQQAVEASQPAATTSRRRSTDDELTGHHPKNMWDTSSRNKGQQPPGSWIQTAPRGPARQRTPSPKNTANERNTRGQQGGRHGTSSYIGLNQQRQPRGWRGEQAKTVSEASPRAGGKPQRRAGPPSQGGTSPSWQAARGANSNKPPANPFGKIDAWGTPQTGSRALGA